MVYGRYNYSIHGVYKPTNITGGHHPACHRFDTKKTYETMGFLGGPIPAMSLQVLFRRIIPLSLRG